MTQEKLRRMVTALTVAGTLLIVTLLGVLIFQWVKIGVQENRKAELNAKLQAQEAINQELGEEFDFVTDELGKMNEAMLQGWVKP